jgi:dihydroorotase
MSRVIIRNGTVLDATGERRADVAVADGVVVAVGPALDASFDDQGATVLDAAGCYVTPGLVDLHVHLREPGKEEAETIETGSRAAALGGFTAVVAMPNTEPAQDNLPTIEFVRAQGRRAGLCEVVPAGCITLGRAGEHLAPLGELAAAGVRLFTDDGNGVQDPGLMRRALEYAGPLGIVLAQHCEVSSLTKGAVMHEGSCCSHLATERSVALVRAAKADGLPVTAEATPHHFTLTDELLASFDAVYKVNPPLRTAADIAAIKAGLADGTIDAIATDHAPHAPEAKEAPLDQAPPGMLGLQTALALAISELDMPLADIVAALSWKPAAIAGLAPRHGGPIVVGAAANLAVFDPAATWTVRPDALASKSRNTPYAGRTLRGMVRHTVFAGDPVVVDGVARR